jgi:hypothetical protein
LNFEDERYVRLYTRDTPTFVSWHWQTRAVHSALLRKLDKDGRIEWPPALGTKALAMAILIPDQRVVDRAIAELVGCETVVVGAGWLEMPRFVPGQNARSRAKTSAERTAEWKARTGYQHGAETNGDDASPPETPEPPSGAVPSPAVPSKQPRARASAVVPSEHAAAAVRILAKLNELRSEGVPRSSLSDPQWILRLLKTRPDGEHEAVLVLEHTAAEARQTGEWKHLNSATPFRLEHFEGRLARAQAAASRSSRSGPALAAWQPPGGESQAELRARLGEGN